MLLSPSIAAYPPSLDRESIRAALVGRAPWPITADQLAALVSDAIGRPDGRWVASPEEALLQAFLTRSGGGGPAGPKFAAPALGRPGYRKLLKRFPQTRWMEPAPGQLDPGADEIAAAIEWGAQAILLTPISGNCAGLAHAAQLCGSAGALLLVDARAAPSPTGISASSPSTGNPSRRPALEPFSSEPAASLNPTGLGPTATAGPSRPCTAPCATNRGCGTCCPSVHFVPPRHPVRPAFPSPHPGRSP
jgi:hypothetical protein